MDEYKLHIARLLKIDMEDNGLKRMADEMLASDDEGAALDLTPKARNLLPRRRPRRPLVRVSSSIFVWFPSCPVVVSIKY